MYAHYERMVENMKFELGEVAASGMKFSVTLDEYSSIANRRFLNVNVHSHKKFWNLGMLKFLSKGVWTLMTPDVITSNEVLG